MLATPAQAADLDGALGGWIEGVGAFGGAISGGNGLKSEPHHSGRSEESLDANRTTIKRAVGWTSWPGVRHYTRAQMLWDGDWFHDKVIFTDSNRVYGVSGTVATSPWSTFNPNVDGSPGSARTFYGK